MADRSAALVTEWTRIKAGAMNFIEAMPEDLLEFKPVPEVFSFAQQMVHIGGVNYILAAATAAIVNPFGPPERCLSLEKEEALRRDKAALAEFVGGSYDFLIAAIRTLSADALDENIPFHKGSYPRSVILEKAIEHHAHHRGQTVIYFRLNGIKPPPEGLF